MMTGLELIAMVRQILHEGDPDFWSPETILINLNKAQQRIAIKMHKMAERTFYESCVIPTVIGTKAYLLPNGTLYGGAKRCMGKIDMVQYGNEKPLPKVNFRRMYDSTPGTPDGIAIAGKYLFFDPTPNVVRNYNLWYACFPTPIAATTDEIDFLEAFEPMIALEAARFSMLKDEADLTDTRSEMREFWEDFRASYCGARIEGEPDEIDFPIEEDINL